MSGLIRADARALPLRDGFVQCVVTSPPYALAQGADGPTWSAVGGMTQQELLL